MEFKDLVKKILRYNKNADISLIERSYKFSKETVENKKRLSGSDWVDHYLDVANLLADLRVDDTCIAAALMHGIIKRSNLSLSTIKREFGEDIAAIIEGLDKLDKIKRNVATTEYNNEDLRKVLLAVSKDIRIILIKLCDKLANMRELEYLPKDEQKRIAREVMDIYAPLAYRLGIGKIKSELEDLSFKYLEPKIYSDIRKKIQERTEQGHVVIYKIKNFLNKEFKKEKIEAEVYGRVKSVHSVYKKLIDRSYKLGNMFDIVALRVLTHNLDDCYKVLKILHTNFRPVPTGFRDYIATPKPNGYRSLHTSIYDNENNVIEFQIRTVEMHEMAEEGAASHFGYKGMSSNKEFDRKLNWIKQLVTKNSSKLDVEMFGDHIFVFTPKGKMVELRSGSTPVDFAYEIHSDIGDKCVGAMVNGKMVQLKTELDNGDIVEIITSKNRKPSTEWLKFVKTTKAKQRIQHSLKSVGKVTMSAYNKREEKIDLEEELIHLENTKYSIINFARCCRPVPCDKIVGKIKSVGKVNIHKIECSAANGKLVKASWKEFENKKVELIIISIDRMGLLAEILNSVASMKLNVSDVKGKALKDNSAECSFKVVVKNLEELLNLIKRLNKVNGVKKVYLGDV